MRDTFWTRGGIWVLGQFAVFGIVGASPFIAPEGYPWPFKFHQVVGSAFAVGGLVLLALAATSLGKSLTPLPKPATTSELCTSGIYGFVRHPIYLGLLLVIFGYCLFLPSMLELVVVVLATLFFDRKAAREELWLRDQYPAYEHYAKRTRRLIPWLY